MSSLWFQVQATWCLWFHRRHWKHYPDRMLSNTYCPRCDHWWWE